MKRRLQVNVLESSLQHAVTGEHRLGYETLRECVTGMWRQDGLRTFYRVRIIGECKQPNLHCDRHQIRANLMFSH